MCVGDEWEYGEEEEEEDGGSGYGWGRAVVTSGL